MHRHGAMETGHKGSKILVTAETETKLVVVFPQLESPLLYCWLAGAGT